MKFYYRYPDRAMAGMSELSPGQRGIYNSVIDLLYARDGIVPCATDVDDRAIAKNISVDIRTWRKFKTELLKLGKIRVGNDGLLDANGVKDGRFHAETYSETQRKRANIRWQNYKLRKKINAPIIPERHSLDIDRDNSEIPSPKEHAKPLAVDNGENSQTPEPNSTPKRSVSAELEANVRRKQEFDKTWR